MLPMKEVPKEVDLVLKEPFIKLRAVRLQGTPLVHGFKISLISY